MSTSDKITVEFTQESYQNFLHLLEQQKKNREKARIRQKNKYYADRAKKSVPTQEKIKRDVTYNMIVSNCSIPV